MNAVVPVDTMKLEAPENEPILIFSRAFKAPRELVWKAVTEREHVARWWGPRSIGPNVKITEHDFRPGGKWRYEHTMNDGSVIVFYGHFLEIDAPERLVMTFGVEGMGDGEGREDHTFEVDEEMTIYRAISRLDSFEDREALIATGMEGGARESWDQLAALIEELQRQ